MIRSTLTQSQDDAGEKRTDGSGAYREVSDHERMNSGMSEGFLVPADNGQDSEQPNVENKSDEAYGVEDEDEYAHGEDLNQEHPSTSEDYQDAAEERSEGMTEKSDGDQGVDGEDEHANWDDANDVSLVDAEKSSSTEEERVEDLIYENDQGPPAKRARTVKRRGFGGN